MVKPYLLTAKETASKVMNGSITAEECLHSTLERIKAIEDKMNTYITVKADQAMERAREIDRRIGKGEPVGRLAGVCVAVKDNLCTKDFRTTCGSKMLETFVPPFNATVVEDLLKEDAVIVGKANMDEFAMGNSTETSFFGSTKNPWSPEHVPGGSSGGSAAAVASGEAIIALGSDTGGSVRCPASFCSVVGLKPTYGLVSRYGLIAYANSLEQIGPISRDVRDCALLLDIISHYDPLDSTSLNLPPKGYVDTLSEDVNGLRIGIPNEFFGEGVDEVISKAIRKGIGKLENLGASLTECSIPTLKYALPAYYLIAMSEASSNLARYDGLRYGYSVPHSRGDWNTVFSKSRRRGFGDEVRRRIVLGTYALSRGYYEKNYLKALQVRTLLKKDFEKIFKSFDVIAGPTMPVLPFKLGEIIDDPLAIYMCDILTVPINLVGCPAISIPYDFVNGLPVGIQLSAPPTREDLLLNSAYALEKNTELPQHCRIK